MVVRVFLLRILGLEFLKNSYVSVFQGFKSQLMFNKLMFQKLRDVTCVVSILFVLLLPSSIKAQSVIDPGVLSPIINLVLDDSFQCPSPSTSPEVIVDDNGVLVGFPDDPSVIQGSVFISDQQSLNNLAGIISITGSLIVVETATPQELDFSALDSLVEVNGSIFFTSNNSSLDGFPCLKTVGEDLNITNNLSLASINGFESLEEVARSLTIFGNPNLQNIGALGALNREQVGSDIIVVDNTSFDCFNPEPDFLPSTFSSGNLVNCTQDLLVSNFLVRNEEPQDIIDAGSISSSITIPVEPNGGQVASLEVELDISHTSVGDLTVTLSNGTTTVTLLESPRSMFLDSNINVLIAEQCTVDSFPEDNFLSEEIGVFNADSLNDFLSIDANCAQELLNQLGGNNTSIENNLQALIAEQCTVTLFPEDDFLNEVTGGRDLFLNDFLSIDADCAFDLLTQSNEDLPLCTSDNISVRLLDSANLLPINSSCAAEDSGPAFSLTAYSPLEALSAFQGSDVNGEWTLTVTDSSSGETGVLNSWSIFFRVDR